MQIKGAEHKTEIKPKKYAQLINSTKKRNFLSDGIGTTG
jgi:hypothetical protein